MGGTPENVSVVLLFPVSQVCSARWSQSRWQGADGAAHCVQNVKNQMDQKKQSPFMKVSNTAASSSPRPSY